MYRARDPRLGREVAIKVLTAEVGADTDRLRRFEQEARAVAALNHPNILIVFDVGTQVAAEATVTGARTTAPAIPYVVMELLQGETLREMVVRRTPTLRQDILVSASADGRRVAALPLSGWPEKPVSEELVILDLQTGDRRPITSHGPRLRDVALDPAGTVVVTGDENGALRVGPGDGREPHLLLGHSGLADVLAVSPDGRWIASASGSEIRLWPTPDVSKPPFHMLPHAELMAKLRALTNLQAVDDPASVTGYTQPLVPQVQLVELQIQAALPPSEARLAPLGSGLDRSPGGLLSNVPSAQAFSDYLVLTRLDQLCRVNPRQHWLFPVLWSCATLTRSRAVTPRKSVAATPISSCARSQGIRARALGSLSGSGRRTSPPPDARSCLGSSTASSAARAALALR